MNKAFSKNQDKEDMEKISLQVTRFDNEDYFKIASFDRLRPFFMSIVSDSNHWMFISSNGGISAGRKNPEFALFPYYTDDKITEFADITGSKTIFRVDLNGALKIWEPFSDRYTNQFQISRNLYKSVFGNKIVFEEENHDLGLRFYYQWNNSKKFGFIRKSGLTNNSNEQIQLELLDGIQNVLPYGVPSDLQRSTSNLVDAYKRTELESESGMGIFALSAIIVDRAEPSEALRANIAWSLGFNKPDYLLSALQLNDFRNLKKIRPENDVKGEKGGYFIHNELVIEAKTEKTWLIVANVNQSQSDVVKLKNEILHNKNLGQELQNDIDDGTQNLIRLVGSADGLQCTSDQLNDTRHYSNVLFNIMRGGIFDDNYTIEKKDFSAHVRNANKEVWSRNQQLMNDLPTVFQLSELKGILEKCDDVDFIRLGIEYLPLKFSRRHGDPSRPWNYFSINTQNEIDHSKILDYEGNWRDLFQNWEALAHSYPEFIQGMIFKFLNATTFDGYNPYRVTKDGFDWETIEHDNPWSYIGYWGDHQIIYLQKFLEIAESHHPGSISKLFNNDWFVYAAVPYIIKPYGDIVKNPKDTILFDDEWDAKIQKKRKAIGADGALITLGEDDLYHVNFMEKILATVLAKLSNFIPEAGIWMNTQRPEWNDANNALVGNGVSMVTLNYLYRFLKFFDQLLDKSDETSFKISAELAVFYHSVRDAMLDNEHLLQDKISDFERKNLLQSFGQSASEYRHQIYENGFWGKKRSISRDGLKRFTKISLAFIAHSIRANKRKDNLYHAYNLITVSEHKAEISHLSEMLEGQVAVLSSGFLSDSEALEVITALKNSSLFRPDQYSYVLYPNKRLPGFLEKNKLDENTVQKSVLLKKLINDGNKQIVEKDVEGSYHFNGYFRNANDLLKALHQLPPAYHQLVEEDKELLLEMFEQVFNHKAFTGRSGTFYGYEGLGSIYWHMVSKLHLAVQECCLKAVNGNGNAETIGKLMEHYYEIDAGIGVHKSPELYGAFPTDPYSHTPFHRGAQQPGMTGQVKEDILVHHGEMGIHTSGGQIRFEPTLLRKQAFLNTEKEFHYCNLRGDMMTIPLKEHQLAFTICQVPVIYTLSDASDMTIIYSDGTTQYFNQCVANEMVSNSLFQRNGKIARIEVNLNKKNLR